MYKEIVTILLGIFFGWFMSFVGTGGGSAIVIFLLLYLNIIPSQTIIAGTFLLIGLIPISIFSIYDFYKKKSIDFYVGAILTIGMVIGLAVGTKYAFLMNDTFGEKKGDKVRFGITSLIYIVLSVLYGYKTIY